MLSETIFYTLVLQVIRLLTGICRTKTVALYMGTAGVGIFSQAQNFQMLILAVSSFSFATGYIQRSQLVKSRYSAEYLSKVHGTVFISLLVSTLSAFFIGFFFMDFLKAEIFADVVGKKFYLIVISSMFFCSFNQAYLEARLMIDGRYKDYVKALSIASVASVLVLFILIHLGILDALAWYLLITSLFSFCALLFYVSRSTNIRNIFPLSWSWSNFRPILKISSSLVVLGLAYYGTSLYLRSIVIRDMGVVYNGYIQVPIVLSGYYMPLITHLLWYVLHPKWSGIDNIELKSREMLKALGMIAVVQTLIVCWIMCFPGLMVSILYTPEFKHGIKTMPIQFFGDFFFFLLTTLSAYLLSQPRIKMYTALWLCFSLFELLSGIWFLTHLKLALRAVSSAYAVAAFMAFMIFGCIILKDVLKVARKDFIFWARRGIVTLVFLSLQCASLFYDLHIYIRLSIALSFSFFIWKRKWLEFPEEWEKKSAELWRGVKSALRLN